MYTNISLIGFMGCGKTTIAKLLSNALNYTHVDTDVLIESTANDRVSNIFNKFGESHFRQLESKVLLSVLNDSYSKVISTGGGIVTVPQNISALKKCSVVIYLDATPQHIFKNLLDDNSRPLLEGNNKLAIITELLDKRKIMYQQSCNYTVTVTDKKPQEILLEIQKILEFI